MDEKTKRLVEEAESRANKTHPGPLEIRIDKNDQPSLYTEDGEWVALLPHQCLQSLRVQAQLNAEFFANAQPDTLALCSAVREHSERADRAEQARDKRTEEWAQAQSALDAEKEAHRRTMSELGAEMDRVARLETELKERSEAAAAWDALAVARLKTLNEQTARILDLTIENNNLHALVGDENN